MKKNIGIAVVIVSSLTVISLAGCATASQTAVEETTTFETNAEITEEAENLTEEDNETVTQTSVGNRSFDGSFINFDDMHFFVNGKKYILGTDTLQTMIDDGVPFKSSNLANADNNLGPNYESQHFSIELDDGGSIFISTMNDTSENKKASECYLCEVSLYLRKNSQQDIISFDFPTDITMEELISACGEPTENMHWEDDKDPTNYSDTIEYSKASENYYGKKHYKFHFNSEGILNEIHIKYIP